MVIVVDWMGQMCPLCLDILNEVRRLINKTCEDLEPWQIIILTIISLLVAIWVRHNALRWKAILRSLKLFALGIIMRVPAVKKEVEEGTEAASRTIEGIVFTNYDTTYEAVRELPETGKRKDQILSKLRTWAQQEGIHWKTGQVSGTVYNGDDGLTELISQATALFCLSNPLHPDIFPNARRMEAEVVEMCVRLFRGDPEEQEHCGCMTAGGTESIVMACKASRNYMVAKRGINKPNIVVPASAHAAFFKAGDLLAIEVKSVPVDPQTFAADLPRMRRAVDRNTVLIVGSAPGFPQGIIDPITELAALAKSWGTCMHVDCCLGGFLVPFVSRMPQYANTIPPFDFRVDGVTSISCDTHKYGFAPKGSSVIMYSHHALRHHHYFVCMDWTGGMYATAGIAGSRSSSAIAGTWASLLYHGMNGYMQAAAEIMKTKELIEDGLRHMEDISVCGTPLASVVAMQSKTLSIYKISDAMTKRGWQLNTLQHPASVHMCITLMQTRNNMADRFLVDMTDSIEEVKASPNAKDEGVSFLYGVAAKVPDKSLVDNVGHIYLDTTYQTQRHK